MTIYEKAIEKMEDELKVWDAQIKLLEAKLDSANSDVRLKQAKAVLDLRSKQRDAVKKLKEMRNTSNEAWSDVKKTSDKIWDELKTGITNVHANFK